MSEKPQGSEADPEKPSVTLPGKVEKIIPAIPSVQPEKAQIAVKGADELYKEIRVENVLHDEDGKAVGLKPGADVEVTIEVEKQATVPKDSSRKSSQTTTEDKQPS